MNNPIESTNLSVAWAKSFLTLMRPGCSEIKPLIVSVDGINGETVKEDDQMRQVLDEALASHKTSCNTVANTIFPQSLWNPARERALLYQRYLVHAWPRIKKCAANNRGTYFRRLIAFENGGAPINQLEHVITTWHKSNHRHSALQLSVFDPRHDHTDGRRLGFPCLHQVCFTPLGANGADGLAVTGFYATQHIFEKAYGNYLGLCRLGKFVAHEMNLRLTRMTCIAACAKLGDVNKTELEPMAVKLRAILEKIDKNTSSELKQGD
jgi:thymidylate synthase